MAKAVQKSPIRSGVQALKWCLPHRSAAPFTRTGRGRLRWIRSPFQGVLRPTSPPSSLQAAPARCGISLTARRCRPASPRSSQPEELSEPAVRVRAHESLMPTRERGRCFFRAAAIARRAGHGAAALTNVKLRGTWLVHGRQVTGVSSSLADASSLRERYPKEQARAASSGSGIRPCCESWHIAAGRAFN